jgi:hypothetical protein
MVALLLGAGDPLPWYHALPIVCTMIDEDSSATR